MSKTETNPFDNIAAEYDRWFDDNRNTFLSELEAIKQCTPKSGKGLEIGVGTGRFAMELGIKHGVEPSHNMAALATQRGIDVVVGNAENLTYKNESFDYAVMVAVDPFVNDIDKVYREVFRILKKGGKIVVGTLHRDGEVARKYMGMTDSKVYKNAEFHKVSESIGQLKNSGFTLFNTCQTLTAMQPEKTEMPVPGHNKGSFVVIEAKKSF